MKNEDAARKDLETQARTVRVAAEIKIAEDLLTPPPISAYMVCPTGGCVRLCKTDAGMTKHLRAGKCQSNGKRNAFVKSSSPVKPSGDDALSTRDLAIRNFLAKIRGDENQVAVEAVPTVQRPTVLDTSGPIRPAAHALNTAYTFGCSVRKDLQHPLLPSEVKFLANWCWDYGDKKGNKRINKAECARLVKLLGTKEGVDSFPEETFWIDAHNRSKGSPLVKEEVENWRIEGFYGQLSSQRKAHAELQAGTVPLNAAELLVELVYFLRLQPLLRGEGVPERIASRLVEFGVGNALKCATLRQMDIKDIPDTADWKRPHYKSQIIEAVRQVGKNGMRSSLMARTAVAPIEAREELGDELEYEQADVEEGYGDRENGQYRGEEEET